MGIILDTCKARKAGEYATFCTALTANAESDFKWNATSKNPVGAAGYFSEGAFQQTLPWWKNDHFDVAASTNAFLDNFHAKWGTDITNWQNVVKDCWEVQRWAADIKSLDFFTRPETANYIQRVLGLGGHKSVARIIADRSL